LSIGGSEWTWSTNPIPTYAGTLDPDEDGLGTALELSGTMNPYDNRPTDPFAMDSDGDGLSDSAEMAQASDPLDMDTDSDGYPWGTNPYTQDGFEVASGTSPTNPDSDGDGLYDGWELALGYSPKNWEDHAVLDDDGDGLSNLAEQQQNSQPDNADSHTAAPFHVVEYHKPKSGWSNGDDMGKNGTWLGLKFVGIKAPQTISMVLREGGAVTEYFSVKWEQVADSHTTGARTSITSAIVSDTNLVPRLIVKNESPEPNLSPPERGADLRYDILMVEFDHAKVNSRNLAHANDDFPDYEHCVAEIWDSSGEVNLENFLTAESLTFKDYVDWYVDGTKQSSSTLNYGSEPGNNEIKDYEVHVTVKNSSTICDRLILVVVPTSTDQAHDDWVTAWSANTAWLAELPAAYSSLAAGNANPEPGTCTPQYWENSVATLGSYFHPGAALEMRSDETPGGHGHQACYTGAGGLITSGVAAGTADSHHKSDIITPSHRTEDVLPFVRAAQLDGNPVWVNDLLPFDLNRPMIYEGSHLQQYLQLRPPIPNSKPLLTPGMCAP